MKKYYFLGLLLLLFLGCLVSQVKTAKTFSHLATDDVSSDLVKLKSGDKLIFSLTANYTTGYAWELIEDYDKEIIELVDRKYEVDNKEVVGSPGVETFTFKTKKIGKTQINLVYKQSWVKDYADSRKVIYYLESE